MYHKARNITFLVKAFIKLRTRRDILTILISSHKNRFASWSISLAGGSHDGDGVVAVLF